MNEINEEEVNVKIENIFSNENMINEIFESGNPLISIYEIIESHNRRIGATEIESNILNAISEFHVNNLIFLKENFNFPNNINCKLMNLLNILLNLKEENPHEDEPQQMTIQSKEKVELMTESVQEDIEETFEDNIDFGLICKRKLIEIKKAFKILDLVHTNANNNTVNSQTKEKAFHLKGSEVVIIMNYIKSFYFPNIRLYYHFINIEKITENKRLEVIINRPLPVPPLTQAVMQIPDKNLFEENTEEKHEEAKNIKEAEEHHEHDKADEKKDDKPETYQDLMNKLNLNAETKKIISEKIEEMYKEVDYKITERQKKLDEKYKEIEDTVKGKKK